MKADKTLILLNILALFLRFTLPFYHALSQALPVSNVSISIFSSVQRTLPALRRCARPVSNVVVVVISVVVVGMVVVVVVPPLRPSRARAF